MRISVPSDGRVGGTPTPRNDSVASVRIAIASDERRDHQHRPQHVGQHVAQHDQQRMRCRSRVAAWTYSLFFSTMVEPRTVRA